MLARLAFLLHAVVETPAAATFLFSPARQLSTSLLKASASSSMATAEMVLILQNLGGLLAASVALSVVMAIWGMPPNIGKTLRGAISLSIASYHVFPCRRAYIRKKHGICLDGAQGKTLGGPTVHLVVHAVCFAVLAWAGIADIYSSEIM